MQLKTNGTILGNSFKIWYLGIFEGNFWPNRNNDKFYDIEKGKEKILPQNLVRYQKYNVSADKYARRDHLTHRPVALRKNLKNENPLFED